MGIGPYKTGETASGSQRWLGSRHGVSNANPGTLDAEAFASAEGVEEGVVPSGTPLTFDDASGLYVPYDGATLSGFLLHDRDINNGDETAAILWHGRILAEHLPVELVEPTNPSAFTLVGASAAGDDTEGGA